jgi:outer membrane lipoprotein-sorting protein
MVTQDQRFNGDSGYLIDSLQGNREMPAEQAQIQKNNTFPTPLLNYKENGSTMELQGKEKVGARDAYVLVGTPKAGPSVRLYLDAETYLPVKTVVKVNVPQLGGEVEQTTELSDYRDVDGVKVPFQSHVSSAIQTVVIKVTKIEQNTTIDPAMFSKP